MTGQRLVGRRVAGYTIGPLLGIGGMAAVYQAASRIEMTDALAIKILREEFAQSPEFMKRFEREAYLLMTLDHPNILPVYDFGHAEGLTFLVMRLVRGPTLYTFEAEHHFSPLTARQILDPLTAALDYAHNRSVVHRDLKPGNVMLEPRPPDAHHIYLSDFGLSKITGTSLLTAAGKSLGTPQYMSPEQVMDYPLDRRSDVYALGVLTYQLLLGRLPFIARKPQVVALMQIKNAPPAPHGLVPNFPRPLEEVLLRALAKHPNDRYETAIEFNRAYAQAIEKISVTARTASYWIGPPDMPRVKRDF